MAKNTLVALQNAVDGLLYMSEGDEPFQVVHSRGDAAGGFKKAQALALCGREGGAPVKSVGLNEFFKDLVQEKDCMVRKRRPQFGATEAAQSPEGTIVGTQGVPRWANPD